MRPTVYLGIGGAGIKTLAHIKHQFEKEYGVGNIPKEIAFVGFDFQTDMDEDPDLATDISPDFIKVDVVANPKEMYEVGRDKHGKYHWMHTANEIDIDRRMHSTSQVRTTGRLNTELTLRYIMSRIRDAMNRLLYVGGGPAGANCVDIHMVMSLAGYTGAGSFITIATAIKNEYDNKVNLYGFGVTHSVFEAMAPMGIMMPNVMMYNCISSIIDLDYMFTAAPEKPIYFEVGGETITITECVFDNFFVIDNKSELGLVITKIDELCEMLGLALYSFNLYPERFESYCCNLSYKGGIFNVLNKIGWVQGLGVCEVVYKGQLLAEVYGLKAALALIRKMRRGEAYVQDMVLPWIEEIGLREDDSSGIHQLICSTCSQRAIDRLRLPDVNQGNSDDANKQECQRYLTNLTQFPSDSYIATLLDGFKTKLDEKVQALLKENGGVGNAIGFVETFRTCCEQFKYEMDSEVESLIRQKAEHEVAFDKKAYSNYISEKHGPLTFGRATKNQELLERLVSYPAREILTLSYEIKRREVASSIYNTLIEQADTLCKKLQELDSELKHMAMFLDDECIYKATSNTASVFEYDLSVNERQNMKVDEADVCVNSFITTLGEQSLLDIDTEILREKMLTYTENLPQAIWYKNVLLYQVVENLSDEDYRKMKSEIERISAPWLRTDSRGECVNITQRLVKDAIIKDYFVSYPIESDEGCRIPCRLENDRDFARNGLMKQFIPIYSENNKQRMIITSVDASVIPYCLAFIDDVIMKHYTHLIDRCKRGEFAYNPHIDKGWFDKMQEENFKLKPEMQDEDMFYWVCAQIFGVNIVEMERNMQKDAYGNVTKEDYMNEKTHTKLVAYMGGKYVYWNEKSIPYIHAIANWQSLGNTSRRDEAFSVFKTEVLPRCKEDFKRLILADYQKRVAYWENYITSLMSKECGGTGSFEEYIDRVVCSGTSSATYYAQNNGELTLLQAEFDYIETNLLKRLSLLI